MSELKAYGIREIDGLVVESESGQLCLKSDVDEVIAELKAQKAQAEDDCAYWKMSEGNAVNAMHETEEYAMQLYKELRHAKYKRCLAMAGYCATKCVESQYTHKSYFTHKSEFRIGHYRKWYKRWLELAEKFKEGV